MNHPEQNRSQEYSLEDAKGEVIGQDNDFFAASADSFFADINKVHHPRSKSVRGNRSEMLMEGAATTRDKTKPTRRHSINSQE